MWRMPAAAAAIALAAAGCGSADDPTLAEAAAATVEAGSSRIAVAGTALDGNDRIEITCSGEAAYEARRLRIACDYGTRAAMEIVDTGTDTYVRGDVFGVRSAGDEWLKLEDGETFGSQLDPHELLAILRGASSSSERIGEEAVRGVDTVQYRVAVECDEVELFDCDGETAAVDVWVDDDGLVRRVAFEEGGQPFTVEFFDFGVDVDIEAPPADRVLDLDAWVEPKPCRPEDGAPLTGDDVADAFRSAGFVAKHRDTCVAGLVAHVVAIPERDGGGPVQCAVYPSMDASRIRSAPSGGVREIANVHCAASATFTSAAEAALAALERKARE